MYRDPSSEFVIDVVEKNAEQPPPRSISWSPEAIDRLCEEVDGARVRFLGTPFFEKYDRVIVSFPGAHGRAWNKLTQGAGGWKTSCVFLPDEKAPGYGVHVKDDSPHWSHVICCASPCFCHALYGRPERWGCRWYQMLLGTETVCLFYPKQCSHTDRFLLRYVLRPGVDSFSL